MKALAKMTAVLGLIGVFATASFAQAPTPAAPATPATPTTSAPGQKTTAVKAYTRKLKNGKVITVRSHSRHVGGKAAMPAMKSVKGYTRKGKNGKMVTVKGYQRKAPAGAKPKM